MLYLNGNLVEVKQFPNGESYVDLDMKLENNISDFDIFGTFSTNAAVSTIKMFYKSDLDLMGLMYLSDYLKGLGHEVNLVMPYIPYSRMDRQEGNRLFTLKSVCRLINSLGFKSVTVHEPHSDVSVALLDRVKVENTTYKLTVQKLIELVEGEKKYKYMNELYAETLDKGIFLVYPDAGASKRYGKEFNYPHIIECNKERDFTTGKINKLTLHVDENIEKCKTAIIVDDLCSRGGTFLMTAQALREQGIDDIYLVVAHCEDTIFDGELLTSDLIKQVITTESILSKTHDKIKIVKL